MDCIESDGIILTEIKSNDMEKVMEMHTSNVIGFGENMFKNYCGSSKSCIMQFTARGK